MQKWSADFCFNMFEFWTMFLMGRSRSKYSWVAKNRTLLIRRIFDKMCHLMFLFSTKLAKRELARTLRTFSGLSLIISHHENSDPFHAILISGQGRHSHSLIRGRWFDDGEIQAPWDTIWGDSRLSSFRPTSYPHWNWVYRCISISFVHNVAEKEKWQAKLDFYLFVANYTLCYKSYMFGTYPDLPTWSQLA